MALNSKYIKYLPILCLLTIASFAWFFGLAELFDIDKVKDHQMAIENYISDHYYLSIIIYMCLYILIVGVSMPGATVMTLLGGFLFDQVVGVVVVVISATVGASILFVSAQLASKDLIRKKASGWIKKMQNGFQENAFSYMLTLRLIPIFPFVAINLVAAVLQIPFRTFFWATLIGIIPGSFVYVTIGSGLHDLTQTPELSNKIIFGLIGLGVIALLPVIYKKIKEL